MRFSTSVDWLCVDLHLKCVDIRVFKWRWNTLGPYLNTFWRWSTPGVYQHIHRRSKTSWCDVNEFPYMKFKTVPITNFQDTIYNFYYQPIIHGIKVLLLQSDVNEEFIFKYRNNDTSFKTYGEQYESDWWNNTQKNIPPDNHLLSIIIYADSTTCDHLGKTSEHPIYISLGNIPNWMRNKPIRKFLSAICRN